MSDGDSHGTVRAIQKRLDAIGLDPFDDNTVMATLRTMDNTTIGQVHKSTTQASEVGKKRSLNDILRCKGAPKTKVCVANNAKDVPDDVPIDGDNEKKRANNAKPLDEPHAVLIPPDDRREKKGVPREVKNLQEDKLRKGLKSEGKARKEGYDFWGRRNGEGPYPPDAQKWLKHMDDMVAKGPYPIVRKGPPQP